MSAVAGNSVGEGSETLWQAFAGERYNPGIVRSRLRDLAHAALFYANDHDDTLPTLASTLFSETWIDDPLAFYNPGDSDPAPREITNDVLNGLDSALVSFEFPAAGKRAHQPFDIMFVDNTAANNAGLGRFAVFIDGHAEFLPADPHVFSPITIAMHNDAPGTIFRGEFANSEPFDFPVSPDAAVVAVAAPHRSILRSEGSVTKDHLAMFGEEGWGDFNLLSRSSSVLDVFEDVRVVGAKQDTIPIVIYVKIDAALIAPSGCTVAPSVQVSVNGSEAWPDLRASTFIAFLPATDLGLFASGAFVATEVSTLSPEDTEHVDGSEGYRVAGIAPLTVNAPVGIQGDFLIIGSAGVTHQSVDQISEGCFARAVAEIELPSTPVEDQIRVFVPDCCEIAAFGTDGPSDLIRRALRGDADLNGLLDDDDWPAFVLAYTGPLESAGHTPGLFNDLATFDFDGDADIDCRDYVLLVESGKTSGWEAPSFPPCLGDDDGDGVADADDDCPLSPPRQLVDQRGCLWGDPDGNGRLDLDDWRRFSDCWSRFILYPECRTSFDATADRQLNLRDAAVFFNEFTGNGP